jgi:transposase-like protein
MTSATEELGEILSQDAQGRVLVSRERRESLLAEYDRSGMSGVKFARYVGIKYSTLAYWLQSRRRHREREKSLMKPARTLSRARTMNNGAWIEAVVENGSAPRVPIGALRIYFAGGAYCHDQWLLVRL